MKSVKRISLVIFDMDGLMFDTERMTISAWIKAGEKFHFSIQPEIVIETIGIDNRGTEKIFKKHFGAQFPYDAIRDIRIKDMEKSIAENGIPIKPGLYELLDFLIGKSVPIALATSTERERTEKFMQLAKIDNCFHATVCGDEVTHGKPDPEIFLKAANKMGCRPCECIVLEDSESGIKAADRAGMIPVLIPDIKRPSEETVKRAYKELQSLHEVKEMLEKWI